MRIRFGIQSAQQGVDFADLLHGLPVEQVLSETPVGCAAHVRDVMARYGGLGITGIVFPVVAPFDFETLRHISDDVASAFA